MNAERNIEEFKPPRELREARTTRTAHEVLGGATVGVLGQIASDPGSERAQVFIDREGGGSPVVVEARWEGDRLDRGRQERATRLLPQFEAAWNNNWQFFLTQSEKRRLQAEKNNQGVAASLKGNGLVRARKAMEDTERLMGEIDLRSRLPNLEVPRAPSRGSDIPPVDERKNGAALNMALGAGLLSASGAKKELKGLRGVLAVVTVAASLAGCRPTPTPRPEPGPTSEIQPIVYEPPATREAPRVERVTLQNQSTVTIINADIIEGLSIGGEKLPTLTPEGGGEGAALPRPLEELVRLNWGEDFIGKGETLTLVQALEAYVSAVGSAGVEKAEATTIDLARSYPGLRGPEGDRHLRFFRGQIVKDRGWEEVLTEVVPRQATLKNGVGIIVTGRYHQGLGEGEIIIGFNDWVYLDESGQLVSRDVPRISFAVIKEKDLPRLLQMINPAITYQDGMIAFPGTTEDGQKVIYEWFINTYSQEAYLEVVKKAGLEYISTAEVPVVPHPSEEQMKLLPEGSQYSHDKGIRGYFAPGPDGVLSEKAILKVEYDGAIEDWVWKKVEAERPAWVVEVSNTEAKFNQEQNVWEYFSTVTGERVVSVRQNAQGEYKFFNYTEGRISPSLHPELLNRSTWGEIAASGAVKCLPFHMEDVDYFEVWRTEDGFPVSLKIHFRQYPATLYWPYNKKGPVVPSGIMIYFDEVAKDPNKPPHFTAWGDNGKPREFTDEEDLVGEWSLATLGRPLVSVKSGFVSFAAYEVDDEYNNMTMDYFAQDEHGRLRVPVKSGE